MVPSTSISLYLSISLFLSCVVAAPMPMNEPTTSTQQSAVDPLKRLDNKQIAALYAGKTLSEYECHVVQRSEPRAQAMINEFNAAKTRAAGAGGQVIKPAAYKDDPPHHRTVFKRIHKSVGDSTETEKMNAAMIIHEIVGLKLVEQFGECMIIPNPREKQFVYIKMKKIEGITFGSMGESLAFEPFTEKGSNADELWKVLETLTIERLMKYAEKNGAAHMDVSNNENLILQGKGVGDRPSKKDANVMKKEFKPAAIDWAQWVPIPKAAGAERTKLLAEYKEYLVSVLTSHIRSTKTFVLDQKAKSGTSTPHTAPESSTGGTPPKGGSPAQGNSPQGALVNLPVSGN
ncbi:hypothetical protein CVT24_006679 [Panaeolus cyanescens]|uniref:Protein kinase domain-containing protein n=1 Tax=Panaeolus cyanescens TaxID=181874 RepID=A0A409YRT9_9AGAR|nr:hypothetical protein CVT24_006679 [Panaeolus cyanescens]